MKTLHVDSGREMQGGQWQVLYLVEALEDASLMLRTDSGFQRLAGVKHEDLSMMALARLAREVDLVHAHTARAHAMAAIAGGAPLVVSRRVGFPIKRSLASRWKYRRADAYLAVSRYVVDQLEKAGANNVRLVYDGVSVPKNVSTREPGCVVALASKPVEIPGIPVHLTSDLWKDLETASVFVYRSEMEGLGSAALAAQAAGVAVIASNVGGLPEAIEHERTGVLVDNDQFEPAIRRLLANPKEAEEMGLRGRERVEKNFTIDIMVEKTKHVYEEVMRWSR
jgi:hypothetical protein